MIYRRLFLFITIGVLCVSVMGCATSQKVTVDDETIANQIKTELESPAGPEGPFEIDILVKEGTVQLDGEVKSIQAKEKAMELAQKTEGVKDVKSFLITK